MMELIIQGPKILSAAAVELLAYFWCESLTVESVLPIAISYSGYSVHHPFTCSNKLLRSMIIKIIVIGRKDGLFTEQTAGGWYDCEKGREKEKEGDWSFRNMLSDGSPLLELANPSASPCLLTNDQLHDR